MTNIPDFDNLFYKIEVEEIGHVKYLPQELRSEYEREIRETPDLREIQPPFINVSDVLRAYFILADYFTDPTGGLDIEPMLIGVKDRNLLVSAVCRQKVSFGGHTKYTTSIDICSTLFFGLVKNHAFLDGNKRVSLLVLLYQLNQYGFFPKAPVREFEKLVVAVAANALNDQYRMIWKKFFKADDCEIHTISYIVKNMVERKDHSFHITITMKEFCDALKANGVECRVENGKIHMTKSIKKGIFGREVTINHSMVFGGWTRVLGAQNAREALDRFGIYDQHPTYKSIMEGNDPLYKLIAEFEQPLRRLKDK